MNTLHILWTNDNKEAFLNMIAMYALNAKKHEWWKQVNLIIWGSSAKLVASDTQVQTEIMEMKDIGISLEACLDCCKHSNTTAALEKLGVDVKYMGRQLTEYLKDKKAKVITF